MSLEVVEETVLILQENQGDFLIELVAAVSRRMFPASGKIMFHFLWEISPPLH